MSARPSTPAKAGRSPGRIAAVVGLCLLCLVGGAALAWWQWDRYESASGTLQNLGYVLQWPLFGVFPAFLFWRILHADRKQALHENGAQSGTGDATSRAGEPERPDGVSHPGRRSRLAYVPVTADTEPGDDKELRMYNRYLAELHEAQLHEEEERRVG